jgi:hypothetical protein
MCWRSLLPALVILGINDHSFADALSRSEGFMPSLTFSESRVERIVSRINPDFPDFSFPEVSASTRTELRLVANMEGQSLDAIDANTGISLTLGDLAFQFTLGDDPSYEIGKRECFIPCDGWNENGVPIGTEGLRLSWNEKTLTLSLSYNGDDDADVGIFGPAIAPSFVGEQDSSIRVLSNLQLSFGEVQADAVCFVAGSATTSSPKVKFGGFEEVLPVTQVQLSASLDLTPPEVRVRTQAAAVQAVNALNASSADDLGCKLCGSSTDARGVAAVRIKLPTSPGEDEQWIDADLEELTVPLSPDEWGRTTVNWSVPIEAETRVGQITYTVVAEDLAGNLSAPVSFTIVNELPDSLVGRWDAIVNDSGSVAEGSLSLMVNKLGKVSGIYRNLQGRYPFVGDWIGDGINARIFTKAGVAPLQLEASTSSLDFENIADLELYGVLLAVDPEAPEASPDTKGEFWAVRCPYSTRSPLPEEYVGRFNSSLGGTTDINDQLRGDSFVVMLAQKNGSVSLVGQLADGTPWTWAGPCGATGQIAMMQYLYGGGGMITGAIYHDGESVWGDGIRWVRPAGGREALFAEGFTLDGLTIEGTRYNPVAASEIPLGLSGVAAGEYNTYLNMEGATLASAVSVDVALGLRGKFSFASPNEHSLRAALNNSTGLMMGAAMLDLANEGKSRATLRALVIGQEIRGFYIGAPSSGGNSRNYGLVRVNSQDSSNFDVGGYGDEQECWWWYYEPNKGSWRMPGH